MNTSFHSSAGLSWEGASDFVGQKGQFLLGCNPHKPDATSRDAYNVYNPVVWNHQSKHHGSLLKNLQDYVDNTDEG